MKRSVLLFLVALGCICGSRAQAQTTSAVQTVKGPDQRFKTDILVVVAHPDDEGGATPYLARAIYDQHKRVAVVFATRGGSGGNDFTREHGPALADIREQEARAACAKLGITNVWFLDGKDTASQNVLNSLANWGHGANLEALVRIVRLTRPEVIITWLPGVFIGENHGDHQASGVLATEAFDMANDPTAFPSQVAGATKRLEAYQENLTPWQPKKLYFFSDADDQKQFAGSGPAYSVKEISPAQRKPYWRLAMDAATPHLTQFPEEIHQMTAMSDEQLNKFMDDPQHSWWTEPMTLIFGQSWVKGTPTGDVFQGILPTTEMSATIDCVAEEFKAPPTRAVQVSLGGPWHFYEDFRAKSCMRSPKAKSPEIAIKAGSSLLIPLLIEYGEAKTVEVKIEVDAPAGWKVSQGQGEFKLPASGRADMFVEVATPELGKEDLKNFTAQEVVVHASSEGQTAGEVRLKVLLKASGLAQ
jgi:LmbE family N-acetylglucosaminyl deacetylase